MLKGIDFVHFYHWLIPHFKISTTYQSKKNAVQNRFGRLLQSLTMIPQSLPVDISIWLQDMTIYLKKGVNCITNRMNILNKFPRILQTMLGNNPNIC